MYLAKIKIDKEYIFPSKKTISVKKFIEIQPQDGETDIHFISKIIDCPIGILEQLSENEFEKLVILGRQFLEEPVSNMGINLPFLPLGKYPFGVYADLNQTLKKFNFDFRAIPFCICLLRPGASLENRLGYWKQWAEELPASVGLFYYYKVLEDYKNLGEQFAALKGDEPDDNEIKAGIEHLNKYGDYLTLVNLSNGDPLKVLELAKRPTNEILTYICTSKDLSTYYRELERLRKPL